MSFRQCTHLFVSVKWQCNAHICFCVNFLPKLGSLSLGSVSLGRICYLPISQHVPSSSSPRSILIRSLVQACAGSMPANLISRLSPPHAPTPFLLNTTVSFNRISIPISPYNIISQYITLSTIPYISTYLKCSLFILM